MRVQRSEIPKTQSACDIDCVYSVNNVCDEPRINKGNSDAKCHKWNNKKIVEHLKALNVVK